MSVQELLLNVRDSVIRSYAHQEFPLPRISKRMKPSTDDCSTWFHVAALSSDIHPQDSLQELSWHTQFVFSRESETITGRLSFCREYYDPQLMRLLLDHFRNLLVGILQNPTSSIRALEMLGDQERDRILRGFNDNLRSYPVAKTLHVLIAEQVKRTPDRVSIVDGPVSLTYQELWDQAIRIERTLVKRGIGIGSFVGVLHARGPDFLTSVLAILKTGAAYVPIDPGYPRLRVEYMLLNSGVSTVLTQIDLVTREYPWLLTLPRVNIVYTDEYRTREASEKSLAIEQPNTDEGTPADPAYMIYTSGSTGRPKGAIVRHDGAVNHIFAEFEALNFTQDDCFLQTAPCCSDISVWQFLAPGVVGGQVVIADDETVRTPALLFSALQLHRISVAELVPSVLALLLEHASQLAPCQRALPNLRWMMVTGEAVPPSLVNQWLKLYPTIPIVNCWGPTEASDDNTQAVIRTPLSNERRPVSIGQTLGNIDVFILDQNLDPLPVGVAGEICVAGIAVGNGYWNDPQQTAEKFVPNPFLRSKGRTLYKTGDLGRWLVDGSIEFQGRLDHQVKIRGVRIEKMEIEAVLRQHPAVKEAVIDANKLGSEKCLVAYWTKRGESATNGSELREYLKGYLPSSMIPAAYVNLAKLPLTANGKIDIARLPVPGQDDATPIVEAHTLVEKVLLRLWSKVLGRNRIGIHDNFFEIGGHSLLATMLASQIRDAFELEIPLRTIFDRPTIADLALWISDARREGKAHLVPPLQAMARPAAIPLSFAQQRLWFVNKLNPNGLYNIPTAVELKGPLNLAALQKSVDEIVRRHEILRTTFHETGGIPFQAVEASLSVPVRRLDLQHISQGEQPASLFRIARNEIYSPFDLSHAPLLRTLLVQLDAEEHALFITTHHIISDGWSMAIFIREMRSLYRSFCRGETASLPEMKIQYADFAMWQRDWLRGEVLEEQLSYWKTQLKPPVPELKLPVDFARPAYRTYEGALHSAVFSSDILSAIEQFSRDQGCTPFMVMLAAFQFLLHRYSGQEDIIVGADIANRNRTETEDLIGFFVNMLVLRTDLSGDPTIKELLHRVRRTAMDAYSHQDVPFERIVADLQPERSLNRNPLFQVLIVLQNMPSEGVGIEELQVTTLDLPHRLAKFDLTLTLEETDGSLLVSMEYSTELFKEETIVRMVRHYENLLRRITCNADVPLSAVDLLSGGEMPDAAMVETQLSRRDLESILLQLGTTSK